MIIITEVFIILGMTFQFNMTHELTGHKVFVGARQHPCKKGQTHITYQNIEFGQAIWDYHVPSI